MIENSGIISWYRENCFVYCMFSTKEKQTNHNLERYPNKMHIFTLHESRCFDFLHVFFCSGKGKTIKLDLPRYKSVMLNTITHFLSEFNP